MRRVEESPLATRGEWFRRWCRPAIDITRSAEMLGAGGSRFGGAPDLEAGDDWPRHEKGPYRFLAQIDLAGAVSDSGVVRRALGGDVAVRWLAVALRRRRS